MPRPAPGDTEKPLVPGVSDNNRRAKYYRLTWAGKKPLTRETREWEQTTEILARFLGPERA